MLCLGLTLLSVAKPETNWISQQLMVLVADTTTADGTTTLADDGVVVLP